MNKRTVVLILVLIVLLGWAWWLFSARTEAPLTVTASRIANGPLTFAFNDEVLLEEVKVVRPAPSEEDAQAAAAAGGDSGGGGVYVEPTEQVMWHLIPRDPPKEGEEVREPRPVRSVRYGGWVRGLRRAPDIPRRGETLEPGVEYVFTANSDLGPLELTFVAK